MPRKQMSKSFKSFSWDEDDLNHAIADYRNVMSVRAAAQKHGVPKSTLFEHITGAAKSCKRGPKTMFSEYEEDELTFLLIKRIPCNYIRCKEGRI
ncbi:hypothetical protein ANN_13855 [Periplaneta americana]|uniref:HTH psq-type domain-containing protein n=1 Tax=Periplaneta americana TaxID=6978 RepID=A0ABQ8SVX3_PERAM|nr:hypothetical protein ANN_13855 [Periplaneta americana]